MAIGINYQKRKNKELFAALESHEQIQLSNTQNYIPLYNNFFALNETNYNSVNLNHKWSIHKLAQNNDANISENKNLFQCVVKDVDSDKTKHASVFFKMAPLLNPFKYLVGKYNVNDPHLFNLPKYGSNENVQASLLDCNNSAYIDGCFTFLTSCLIHQHDFIHGVDYYGSFLAIKNNFMVDVIDDLDYLTTSDFFNAHKDKLFTIEDYSHLIFSNEKMKPIKIHNGTNRSNNSKSSILSIKTINNEMYEDLFEHDLNSDSPSHVSVPITEQAQAQSQSLLSLDDLKDMSLEIFDVTENVIVDKATETTEQHISSKSDSSCSSRSSHTNSNDFVDERADECDEDEDHSDHDENNSNNEDDEEDQDNSNIEVIYISDSSSNNSGSNSESGSGSSGSDYEEEKIYATINKFPVQIITMEYCENTFDNLIETSDLTNEEWLSALMQIIMILITYQKAFAFTHNDLHTNNVMYNTTELTHIYYLYNNKYYKVPTFGRLFKIIDYGRSIYKFKNHVFCSDSYKDGGDASTQYNTEPFFNPSKPRLEPNYSFDLCRLACSLYDFVIEENDNVKDTSKLEPFVRIILEWCMDDNNINVLYKTNGAERYPGFKLYKMIARLVHNHLPKNQLDRPEFSKYLISKSNVKRGETVINIDAIPALI